MRNICTPRALPLLVRPDLSVRLPALVTPGDRAAGTDYAECGKPLEPAPQAR